MFIIDCPTCEANGRQHRQLLTNHHLVSMRRSDTGPVATVRCLDGHLLEHRALDRRALDHRALDHRVAAESAA